MKSALAIAGVVIVAMAAPAVAQEPGGRVPVPHQQLITGNPFALIAGWFNGEYERKLTETWTVGLGGSYLSLDDGHEKIGSANAVFRYYPQGAALHGFYIGPRLGFFHVNDLDDSESSAGAGFELGYTWLLGENRNFNISLGAGATKLFTGPVVPTVRLINVGWAF